MIDGTNLIGKVLGTCTLEKLIGRGGMSTVYLARQAHPSRYVAVKVLRQRPGIEREDYSIFLTRFQREADIVAKLEHVNIVPIFEYGEQDQLAYLVMPYISGGSLSQLLAKYGKFTLNQSLHFIQQAAAALDYAHAHNVIHRDLKPSNFLVYPDGRLVLADFGIARIAGRGRELGISTLTLTGEFLGTPAYMSPEMLRSEPTDSRTDIYALGIVLFQMLSGNTPFGGNNAYAVMNKHLNEPLPSLREMDPAIPLSVDTVLQKATAKRRNDRYSSAGTLAQALRATIKSPDAITYRNTHDAAVILSSPPQVPLSSKEPISNKQPGNEYGPDSVTLSDKAVQPFLPERMPPPILKNKPRPWPKLLKALPIIALIIGGLLIGLRVMGVFAGSPQRPGVTNTPVSTTLTPTDQVKKLVQQYYDYINNRDYHAAYDLLTPKFQQSKKFNVFSTGYQQDQRDDISFSSITENSVGYVSVVATLQVLGTNSLTKRYHWTCTVLQQSDGTWKIDTASLQEITSVKHSSAIISDKS